MIRRWLEKLVARLEGQIRYEASRREAFRVPGPPGRRLQRRMDRRAEEYRREVIAARADRNRRE